MENKLVSVIIPVYNAEKYLKKCLNSIFNQSYKKIEVICINDGSSDGSLDILDEYIKIYEEKMIVKTIENSGQANARNIGINIAKGEFVMFVDSDDYIDKFMIENLVRKQSENNADMVVCNIDRIFEGDFKNNIKKFNYDTSLNLCELTTIDEHPEIICFLTAAPYAKLIKRSFINDNNISFIKGYIYEDLVFTQNILSHSPSIEICKESYYKYMVRQNTTMTSKKSNVVDMFYAYDTLFDYYKNNKLETKFKEELDFLCYYHVLIGTSYRMWNSKQYSLFSSIMQCRRFIKKYNCKKHNKYLKEKGMFAVLYVRIFG